MSTKQTASIFLIGMMASGKTTIGWHLAQRLGWEFFDVDRVIEKRCGVPISFIFETEGEEGFRARERKVVAELTARNRCVVSMGGGAPMFAANQQCLARGLVVELVVTPADVLERTRYDKTRPLLQAEDPEARIRSILAQRQDIYHSLADVHVTTSHLNPHAVVEQLLAQPEVLAVVERGNELVEPEKNTARGA